MSDIGKCVIIYSMSVSECPFLDLYKQIQLLYWDKPDSLAWELTLSQESTRRAEVVKRYSVALGVC